MLKGKIYPRSLFMVKYEDGSAHWFLEDPLYLTEEERKEKEQDLATLLDRFYAGGASSFANPVKVMFNGAHIVRSRPWDSMEAMRIAKGTSENHVEDMDGNIVILLDKRSSDETFLFIGDVYDRSLSTRIEQRLYDNMGNCKDGESKHGIRLMKGKVQL